MSGDSRSFCGFGLHVGTDGWVSCHHYAGSMPILVISAAGSSYSITPASREGGGEAAVEFARALLRNVQEFAADIERAHAARLAGADGSGADNHDDDTSAAGGHAA